MKEMLAELLEKETKLKKEEILSLIEIPPEIRLGDFAFPCFTLAKTLKKAPVEIAKDLATALEKILPEGIISFASFKTVPFGTPSTSS